VIDILHGSKDRFYKLQFIACLIVDDLLIDAVVEEREA
jgi:hypothetical protein